MNQIKFLAASLLSLNILALHVTAPQRHVVYIPAVEEDYKVRPAGMETPVPLVISLEEAVQRHDESASSWVAGPDQDDSDLCMVKNCSLDLRLFWAKHFLKKYIAG